MVLPTFTALALPAGVTTAIPGTLTRIFALIELKRHDPEMFQLLSQLWLVDSQSK
jgi:hypothetical protein